MNQRILITLVGLCISTWYTTPIASIFFPDDSDQIPLYAAVQLGDIDRVTALLDHGDTVDQMVEDLTLLHVAALQGHVAIAKVLIEKGAHINNAENVNRETPLHCAAGKGHVELVNFLIASDALTDVYDKNGYTPADKARAHNHPYVAELLQTGAITK